MLEARAQWRMPWSRVLINEDKLLEVRFDAGNVEWRVFGFHQPGFVFVVAAVGSHKGKTYDPKGVLAEARKRMKEILANQAKAKNCERPQ